MPKNYMAAVLWLMLSIGLIYSAVFATAQDGHQHGGRTVIDGREHPELIPDVVAYRLFFLAVSPVDHSDAEMAKEEAHIGNVGLMASDQISLKLVVENFRSKYEDMVQVYNLSVPSDRAGSYANFEKRVNDLVESSRRKLRTALSAAAYARLEAHVQTEKAGMQQTTGW